MKGKQKQNDLKEKKYSDWFVESITEDFYLKESKTWYLNPFKLLGN